MSTTFTLPSASAALFSRTFANSISSSLTKSLVTSPSSDRLAADVNTWLLSHVHPDNLTILWVDCPAHLFQGSLESRHCRLSTAVNLVSRDPPEVGASGDWVRKLLDFLKVVGHRHGLPDLLGGHDGAVRLSGRVTEL